MIPVTVWSYTRLRSASTLTLPPDPSTDTNFGSPNLHCTDLYLERVNCRRHESMSAFGTTLTTASGSMASWAAQNSPIRASTLAFASSSSVIAFLTSPCSPAGCAVVPRAGGGGGGTSVTGLVPVAPELGVETVGPVLPAATCPLVVGPVPGPLTVPGVPPRVTAGGGGGGRLVVSWNTALHVRAPAICIWPVGAQSPLNPMNV